MAGPTRSSSASPSGRSGLAAVGVLLLLQSQRTCHSLILSRQTVSMIDPRGWNREREKRKKTCHLTPSTFRPSSHSRFIHSLPLHRLFFVVKSRPLHPPPSRLTLQHAAYLHSRSRVRSRKHRGRESNCIPPIIIIIIIIFSVLLYPLVLSPSSISFLGRALFLFIHPPPSTTNTNSPSSWSPSHHMTTLARPAFGCPSGAYSPSSHKR